MTKPKRGRGRPALYSQELAAGICDLLADGQSLRSICKQKQFPSIETVRKWLRDKPEFLAQYARARDEQADTYAADMVDIADDPNLDPNDKRVRIDARKWIASKLKPKVYGDKIDVTSNGEALPAPGITVELVTRQRPGDDAKLIEQEPSES